MIKLKKQFSDFYDNIKISTEANDMIKKREILQKDFEDYFPGICKDHDITVNKSDMEFFDQGSYRLNTTIKNKDGSVDRDVAVTFPLDINENDDPRKLKKYGREALLINNVREPKIKEPCITVSYIKKADEYLHIDFPMYAKHNGKLYLARGKENSDEYKWEEADPKGLNSYFDNYLVGNDQLRRIVRYIKKWKQEKYSNSDSKNSIPPSIGLTLLACTNFVSCTSSEGDDDLQSLYKTIKNIVNAFSLTYDGDELVKAEIICDLPVEPKSDIFYKLKNSDAHGVKFYNRLKKACDNLENANNLDSEYDAATYVQKVLGDEFELPEKKSAAAATVNKREHGFG